ncbi:MAG: lysophospholipid acyltransferase family protein [Eubacteriales bacterium]|nr:lysophospholipid acyltransferase family protein [Eubacteriales bacterium]
MRSEQPPDEKEHVIHLWAPFHLKVGPTYDYLGEGFWTRLGGRLLKPLVYLIFPAYNRLLFGLRIEGEEILRGLVGGAVTVCNHVHMIDCTMVAQALGYRRRFYMATLQSNLEIPVIRHLVRQLGGIPIPQNPADFFRFYQAGKQALQRGDLLHVYPEGVLRPYYDGLRTFENGAFSFAYDAEVPVIPMVLLYRRETGFPHGRKKRPCLTLKILEPVYPRTDAPRRAEVVRLKQECRRKMEEAMNGERGKAPLDAQGGGQA